MASYSRLTISDGECVGEYMKAGNVIDEIIFEFLQSMMYFVVENIDSISIDENNVIQDQMPIISNEKYQNEKSSSNSVTVEESVKNLFQRNLIFSQSTFDSNESNVFHKDEKQMQNLMLLTESTHTSRKTKTVYYKVKVELQNRCVYEGCILNWKMQGFGRYQWTDGSTYEGMFSNNEINGLGKMIWPDLCWYEGYFLHGWRHGFGTFSIANTNTTYRGEWVFGKRHGKGRIIYNENQYYDGEWYEDKFHGIGKQTFDCESWYHGNWCEGKQQGYGKMCWRNDDFYVGDWFNGLMHGYGKYTWDGEMLSEFIFLLYNTYIGMWKHGERSGFGILMLGYSNGAAYQGQFLKNLKHGEGAIICGNGKVIYSHTLFQYDNPVHIFSTKDDSRKIVDRLPKNEMIIFNPLDVGYKSKCDCQDCVCDPKALQEKDRILYCIEKTIDIPLHESMHTIDLSFHLLKLSTKNIKQKDTLRHLQKRAKVVNEIDLISFPIQKLINVVKKNSPQYKNNMSSMNRSIHDSGIIIEEERFIYNCFILHLPQLWEIYQFYSYICSRDIFTNTKYKGVMIRLFLWQMYRDCDVMRRVPLVKTDIMFAKNRAALLRSIYYPFEQIYFFQFLHSLLTVAWELYGDSIDGQIFGGSLLASVLHKFLQNDIYPNVQPFRHNGVALFKYRDLAPIKAMYKFYQSVDEPMSVRNFIQLFVPPKLNKVETVLNYISARKLTLYNGINAMIFNSETYAPQRNPLWGYVDNECEELLNESENENTTLLASTFGILEIIDSLSAICPLVCTETLLNIDFKINFLEFYEVLIECLERNYSMKTKKETHVTNRISQESGKKSLSKQKSFIGYFKSKFQLGRRSSLKSKTLSNTSKLTMTNVSVRSMQIS